MAHRIASTKRSNPILRFIGDIIAELKKVVWLSRREAIYLTGMVLIVAAAAGVVLGALDYGFSQLIDRLFLGG